MGSDPIEQSLTLEGRIFKNSHYIALLIVFFLLLYDSFFSGDMISVIIEIVALFYFSVNLYLIKKRGSSLIQHAIFSFIIAFLVNAAWITGGGISLLQSAVIILGVGFILTVNEVRFYKLIFILIIINYCGLFFIEYYLGYNLLPSFNPNKIFILKDYIIVMLMMLFGGYLIVFLKLNYSKERSNLNVANQLLKQQTKEITIQNDELIASKEVLDRTVAKLDRQKSELEQIKGSLEEMVEKRTNDLLKMNEQLLSQNQQLEQYAYITSHNLRAPVAQIKGLVHLLPLQRDFDNLTKETFHRLEESTESIEKVFGDLSTILNVKNSMQMPWEQVDVVPEIEKIIIALKPSLEEKKIEARLPSLESFEIKALRPYVYSILHNLIENAVKYSDDSKKRSWIEVALSESSQSNKISIIDNGLGIDMEMASGKIFQMYQRFNNTHPGQGFGLFLVKSQMEAMGGQVKLQSVLGEGSSFDLYFPKR